MTHSIVRLGYWVCVAAWLALVGTQVVLGDTYDEGVLAIPGVQWFPRMALVLWVVLVAGGFTVWRGPWVWPMTAALCLLPIPVAWGRPVTVAVFLAAAGIVVVYGVFRLWRRASSELHDREQREDTAAVGERVRGVAR